MRDTSLRIKDLLAKEIEILGGGYRRVFLAGLSQGCTTVLATHMWHDLRLGGIICLHGQHKASVDWENTDVERKNAMPMFLWHGDKDETLHLENA